MSFTDRCFNPFEKPNHRVTKDLRHLSEELKNKWNLDACLRACSSCRKELQDKELTLIPRCTSTTAVPSDSLMHEHVIEVSHKREHCDSSDSREILRDVGQESEHIDHLPSSSSTSGSQPSSDEMISSQTSNLSVLSLDTQIPVINQALEILGESPIKKKKLKLESYIEKKSHQVSSSLKRSLTPGQKYAFDPEQQDDARHFRELLDALKAKFHSLQTDKAQKLQILTLLPQDWGEAKIAKVMNTTVHMARTSKALISTKGILSLPDAKKGDKISEDVKTAVIDFYNDDRNCATMPGKKDFVSIRDDDGTRKHVQKKLILSNLRELYSTFQLEHSDKKIGFSTFACMRPKHCVLAGASGTHTICVCSVHQNIKLMIAGCSLNELTKDSTLRLSNYQDCIALMVCPDATEICHLGECSKCPGTSILSAFLDNLFSSNEIEQLTYKQWVNKPRTSLETFVKDSCDFLDEFCKKMQDLCKHAFISKSQSNFMKSLKESLQEGEFLVISDFAENYAFVIQEAAPGFHWNNTQATVYTTVIYFKDGHKSLVIISDNLSHDAVAVNIYTKIVVDHIKSISNNVSKIYYFSDGAPQQFKNYKNVASICHHENDFAIKAEWHFFATAHGKGPCDGIGGTLKRLAAKASLQRPFNEQITTARELYNWANEPSHFPNAEVRFSSEEFYFEENLASR